MPIHVALNSIYLPKTEGMVLQNAHSRFGLNEELWSHSLSKIERGGQHYEQTSHDGAMAAPTEHQARGVRRISSEVATRRTFWGDKAVILLIRFLKAERNVGQGDLQDSYGRIGKLGLNLDIERLSYRSHCLFSLPPLPHGSEPKKRTPILSVPLPIPLTPFLLPESRRSSVLTVRVLSATRQGGY